MAVSLHVSACSATALPDFVERVERTLDHRDDATLLALAPDLAALAQNPTFLAEHVTRELASPSTFQSGTAYFGGSLVVARGKSFVVRANLWEPAGDGSADRVRRQLGMYGLLHDHDFSFVTVGYAGPGYETTLFECEPERIEGYLGEHVELRSLGTATLGTGALLYFERRRHVHEQGAPAAPSASLNLIALNPETSFVSQYYISQASRRIVAMPSDAFNGRNLLCDFAQALGDERSCGPLHTLARSHPSPGLRVAASRALASLSGEDAPAVWRAAEHDPHPLVRRIAREARGEPRDDREERGT